MSDENLADQIDLPDEEEEDYESSPGGLLLLSGIGAGLLWGAGAGAFLIGFHGFGDLTGGSPSALAGIAFVMIGPAIAFTLLGYAGREMARFAATSRRLEFATLQLVAPVDTAKAEAATLTEAISRQIDLLNRAAEGSLARLAAMEEVLRHHADSVQAASTDARKEVDILIENLSRERVAIGDLAEGLRTAASGVSDTIDQQAQLIDQASEAAATQAEESRAMLEKSADKLASAGGATQKAGERVAVAIGEQLRDLEALVEALDNRGERLEEVASVHSESVKIAQNTSQELALAAEAGAEAMKRAVDSAIDQTRRFSAVIDEETRRAAEVGASEVDRVRRAAQSARDASGDAGRVLETNVQALVDRVEELNAMSVNTATRTNEAFESRIKSVERAIAEVDERIAELPRTAEAHSRQLMRALQDGLRELDQVATRANANNHQQAAYLEQRNHVAERPQAAPPARRRPDARAPAPAAAPPGRRNDGYGDARAPRGGRGEPVEDPYDLRLGDERVGSYDAPPKDLRGFDDGLVYDDAPEIDDRAPPQRGANGRGRERDRRGGGRPEPEAPQRGGRGGSQDDPESSWRWKDLLNKMDDEPAEAPATDSRSGDSVVQGLRRAGVDPHRAFDPDMTSRIARARRRAGVGEARALVLDGALNEVRRTAAALAADANLRQRAEEFLDDHARNVRHAIDANDATHLGALLDSEIGRAYLLVDAALADV